MGYMRSDVVCQSMYSREHYLNTSNQSYHSEPLVLGGVGQIDVTAYEHSTTGAVSAPHERSGELERIGCSQSMYCEKTFGVLPRLFGWLYFTPSRAQVCKSASSVDSFRGNSDFEVSKTYLSTDYADELD
jgi:hypothetical protein